MSFPVSASPASGFQVLSCMFLRVQIQLLSLGLCLSPHSDQLYFLLFCPTFLCKQIYFHYFRLCACLRVCVGTCTETNAGTLWVGGVRSFWDLSLRLLTPMRRSELRSSAKGTSLCRFGWLWTHWALHTSAMQVIKWKERVPTSGLFYTF